MITTAYISGLLVGSREHRHRKRDRRSPLSQYCLFAHCFLMIFAVISGCSSVPHGARPLTTAKAMSTPLVLEQTALIRDARVGGTRPALIVALHGYGMDERQIETLVNIEPDIDHVLIAPRGPYVADGGGHAWVPIEFVNGALEVKEEDYAAFIDQFGNFVAEALEFYRADAERVYIVGYSQGGAMAISLAIEAPRLAAGFFGIAGAVLPQTLEAAGLQEHGASSALFVAHGTRDPAVSHEQMRADIERLRRSGVLVEYLEYPVPHVVSAAQRRDVAQRIEELDETAPP